VRHEWLLRKKAKEGTYRSTLENRAGAFVVEGDFGAVAEDARGTDDWPAAAKFFLMAPTVAAVAADAFTFRVFAWRFAASNAVGLVTGAVAGAEQLWSAGKRCAGQNCALHF
jgi:hypothetical protein